MTYTQSLRLKKGFSLVEILIALTIIAIISAVIIPNTLSYLKNARTIKTQSSIRALEGGINMYNAQIGQYPSRLAELVDGPTDAKLKNKFPGSYFKQKDIFNDAWDNRFQYKLTPQAEHKYELYSYGPNGKGSPKNEWISVWDL